MSETKPRRDIIAVGASAGGIDAMRKLLAALPSDLAACVMIVLHRPPEHADHLVDVLQSAARIKVTRPRNGETPRQGVCYVPMPSDHLTLGPEGRIRLLPNGFYRAHNIDALFCSLAVNAGPRTIGVILSGILKDGAFGLRALKDAGGITLVQSPEEADYADMPLSAIEQDHSIDLTAPITALARRICELVGSAPETENALEAAP